METNCGIYFHINPVKNEVFYVGLYKNKKRPYVKSGRSIFWKRVVKKYKGYVINIIHEGLTWKEACEKEIYYIKYFGRRDLNLGPLVNMADGGEGNCNVIITQKQKDNLSRIHKGKIISQETRDKISKSSKGRIAWNTGLKMSQEFIDKISGYSPWNKGVKITNEEYLSKIRLAGLKGAEVNKKKIDINLFKDVLELDISIKEKCKILDINHLTYKRILKENNLVSKYWSKQYIQTEESKKKISESKKGRSSWNKGLKMRSLTDEEKLVKSIKMKGVIHPKTKENLEKFKLLINIKSKKEIMNELNISNKVYNNLLRLYIVTVLSSGLESGSSSKCTILGANTLEESTLSNIIP